MKPSTPLRPSVIALALAAAGIAFAAQPPPPDQPPPAQTEDAVTRADDLTARRMEATPEERRAELQALARSADRLAQKRFDEMQRDLERNWSKLNARSREQARAALDAARREQAQFRAEMHKLDANSTSAWTDVRAGVVAAYRDLAYALSTARREFAREGDVEAQRPAHDEQREEEGR